MAKRSRESSDDSPSPPARKTPSKKNTAKKNKEAEEEEEIFFVKAKTSRKSKDQDSEEEYYVKRTKQIKPKDKPKPQASRKKVVTIPEPSPPQPDFTKIFANLKPYEKKMKSEFEQDYLKRRGKTPSARRISLYLQEKKIAADARLKDIGTENLDKALRKFVYDHGTRGTKAQDMQPIYAHLGISDNRIAQNTVKVSTLGVAIGTAYQQLTSRGPAT
jgi:hypothetical protein